jgi:regulator of RNase E activity RraA
MIEERLLEHLRAFDTPTICNALEVVAPDRRATGFTSTPFVCAFPELKPIVGFARTATIRAAEPSTRSPAEAKALRLAYYEYVASPPMPTITVLQDLDPEPGFGAFWGEVNTAIHKGLGVAGCITNGSIRDLDLIAPEFQLLASKVGPSHAWVRVEEIEVPVEVHGMAVSHGDLIHADRHGAVVIPLDLLDRIPAAIELLTRREAAILKVARLPGFDAEKLKAAMAEAEEIH